MLNSYFIFAFTMDYDYPEYPEDTFKRNSIMLFIYSSLHVIKSPSDEDNN